MEPVATRIGVELHLSVPEALPPLYADPNRLEQVVNNLLYNALRYGADGKRIDARALGRGGMIRIEVQDYGQGIDPAARMKIFEPKVRPVRVSGAYTDMGIGLALCRELVEQHGGVISLNSEEGKGSLFAIELPIDRKAAGKGTRHESSHNRGQRRDR
jgi:two-component system sensor histidine kinase BaeS